ncbi:hypothetical protein NQ318_003723 [Aromia moschata]|uniref:Serine carboxypeptidase n=1 Tax=Aromia moschata TaxID=1265417 RepID=A0AAV8XIB1_9CUCU|nr:hypothetical protein NQ318_003723 [Aromia moschata]
MAVQNADSLCECDEEQAMEHLTTCNRRQYTCNPEDLWLAINLTRYWAEIMKKKFTANIPQSVTEIPGSTPGTIKWVDNLHWIGRTNWDSAERTAFAVDGNYEGYVKKAGNFAMYWINRSGHMVPADNPAAMNYILQDVTNYNN